MTPSGVTAMPANDVLALDLFYEDWCKTRLIGGKAPRDLQPFEYFVGEQFLKRFSLNDDELIRGMVGAQDDGGIDAFFFFINRVLADDSTDVDRRSENEVDVILMQIRENKGFSPTALEKIDRFADDLLDLTRKPDKYRYAYHARLQNLMAVFKQKMTAMAHAKIRFEFYFVTRNDVPPNDNCQRAARTICATVRKHYREAEIQPFNFVGAQRLYDETRIRKPSKKYLTFSRSFDTPEGWVGVVPLRTYYEFLRDDRSPNVLNETIFDDNVRGYYLNTPVNRAISTTLSEPKVQPEFWLLNNGITILTPRIGLKSGSLEIQDPQIVNGLQTSRRIFDYFSQGASIPGDDTRRIVVRVIQNENEEFRDQIIRATNNQNKMAAEALISTSRLHKQLDAFFEKNGLFYDRRKGHYKDKGKEIAKIISIITLVQAVVAIILGKPNDARGRPRDYVTKDRRRYEVFGHDDYDKLAGPTAKFKPFDLEVYLRCVLVLRRIDQFIEDPNRKLNAEEQRNLRFYLARYAACRLMGSAYCTPKRLVDAKGKSITDAELAEGLRAVKRIYRNNGGDDDAAKGTKMAADLEKLLLKKFPPPKKVRGGAK